MTNFGHQIQSRGQADVKKNCPIFQKCSLNSLQAKKGQNIYNKVQFESPKRLHQTTFKTLEYIQQTMF